MLDDRRDLVEGDPAPPLPTVAEWSEVLGHRGEVRATEDARDPQLHDPDSGGRGGGRGRLAVALEVGQEVGADRALLGQDLVTRRGVDAHARRADEDLGLARPAGQRLGQEPVAADPVVVDALLGGGRPARRPGHVATSMTASKPSRPSASIVPASGSQRTSPGPARGAPAGRPRGHGLRGHGRRLSRSDRRPLPPERAWVPPLADRAGAQGHRRSNLCRSCGRAPVPKRRKSREGGPRGGPSSTSDCQRAGW